MKIFKSILLLLFVLAVVIFTLQNLELVNIRFLDWHMEIPLSLASVLFYIMGAISGGLLFSMLIELTSSNSRNKKD